MKNMKRFFLCCMLCAAAHTASAQALIALMFGGKIKNDNIKLGIYLGASGSWITHGEGQQPKIGLAIGAYTSFKLKSKLDLCMYIIMKSPKGARQLNYSERLVQPGDSVLLRHVRPIGAERELAAFKDRICKAKVDKRRGGQAKVQARCNLLVQHTHVTVSIASR